MNHPLYFIAAALFGTQFLAAQAPKDWTLRVDLAMSGDNGALKSEVQSHVSRELRALNRNVSITAAHPSYRLRVGTVSLGDRAGAPGGFAVSYIYSSVEEVPPNPIFGAERDKEVIRSGLAMLSGAKGEERSVCQKLVAAFDAAVLKDARVMTDAIRKGTEGKE